MRTNPWTLLTTRGKAFVLIGLAVAAVSIVLGQRDVLWIGIFLLLLPAAAMVVVARARLRLSCERRVSPSQAVVGDRLVGELVISKHGTMPTGLLRFEDEVPRALGRRPRFSVHRFGGEWSREISYPMMGLVRGKFETGPLTVRATDPFGLVKLDRSFTARSAVMVIPRIVPLPIMRNAAGAGLTGDSSPQKVGVVGQDDVLLREYQTGDDVRRIHWRTTARRGEMMVRREEQAWDPAATVILDSRLVAHAGAGRESSFEWAVSAAASIALHFLDVGFRVEVIDADGAMISADRLANAQATRQQILDKMTEVKLTKHRTLERTAEAATLTQRGQLMVAVTGRLTPRDVELLVSAQRNRTRSFALVVDPDTFTARSERSTPSQYDDHQVALGMLRDHRWRVVEVSKGDDLTDSWQSLDRMGAYV